MKYLSQTKQVQWSYSNSSYEYYNKARSHTSFWVLIILIELFLIPETYSIISADPIRTESTPSMQAGLRKLSNTDVYTDLNATIGYLVPFQETLNLNYTSGSPILSTSLTGMDVLVNGMGYWFYIKAYATGVTSTEISIKLEGVYEHNWVRIGFGFLVVAPTYPGEFHIDYAFAPESTYIISSSEYIVTNFATPLIIGRDYTFLYNFYGLSFGTIQSSVSFGVQFNQYTHTNFTVQLFCSAMQVYQVWINVITFQTDLLQSSTAASRFIVFPLQQINTSSVFNGMRIDHNQSVSKGIQFTQNNFFLGVSKIQMNSHYNFDFTNNNGDLKLFKAGVIDYLQFNVLLFYGYKCQEMLYYDQQIGDCQFCPNNCLQCDSIQCFECSQNYTLYSNNTKCVCTFQSVSGVCYDFDNSDIKGCINAYINNLGQFKCRFCSPKQYLILETGKCQCQRGFQKNSSYDCYEICGDGVINNFECDDGNTIDGDGCSSLCALQGSQFDCDSSSGTTICKSQMDLTFRVLYTHKNSDNSAVFSLIPINDNLPFTLKKANFISSATGQSLIRMSVFLPSEQFLSQISILSVSNNIIQLKVPYNFTLQSLKALFYIDLSQTQYNSDNTEINFQIQGDNKPVKYSTNLQIYESISTGMLVLSCSMLVFLFIGLLAPKFIGLQAIVTMQMIFFSQLLIIDTNNWPVGFLYLESLKYSTGYNEISGAISVLDLTSYIPKTQISRKLFKLSMHKTIIENFNISFVILILTAVIFFITCVARHLKQTRLLNDEYIVQVTLDHQNNKNGKNSKNQNQMMTNNKNKARLLSQQQYMTILKINTFSYNSITQISLWCLLPLFSVIATQVKLQNSIVILTDSSEYLGNLLKGNALIAIVSVLIILIIGLNHFYNILLSSITMGHLLERPSEILYKKITFLYIFAIGIFVLCLSQMSIGNVVPCSAIVLVIHTAYFITLIIIKPYQLSLDCHKWGLLLNQAIFLIFLICINMLNFMGDIQQVIVIALGYGIMGGCVILVIMTSIRLYYEYRYGQELQKQIQKQREQEQKLRILKQQQQLKRAILIFQEQAKQRLNQDARNRNKNIYLYENQVKQDEMNDLLDWLDTRTIWTQQMKEKYYFEHFDQKPLKWLKKNKPQEYVKCQQERQVKKNQQNEKKQNKKQDPEYIQLVSRLRSQLKETKKLMKAARIET